eukprot:scaffold1830_cov246-Pinguiococcus_pyrenoidosus.AAC.15
MANRTRDLLRLPMARAFALLFFDDPHRLDLLLFGSLLNRRQDVFPRLQAQAGSHARKINLPRQRKGAVHVKDDPSNADGLSHISLVYVAECSQPTGGAEKVRCALYDLQLCGAYFMRSPNDRHHRRAGVLKRPGKIVAGGMEVGEQEGREEISAADVVPFDLRDGDSVPADGFRPLPGVAGEHCDALSVAVAVLEIQAGDDSDGDALGMEHVAGCHGILHALDPYPAQDLRLELVGRDDRRQRQQQLLVHWHVLLRDIQPSVVPKHRVHQDNQGVSDGLDLRHEGGQASQKLGAAGVSRQHVRVVLQEVVGSHGVNDLLKLLGLHHAALELLVAGPVAEVHREQRVHLQAQELHGEHGGLVPDVSPDRVTLDAEDASTAREAHTSHRHGHHDAAADHARLGGSNAPKSRRWRWTRGVPGRGRTSGRAEQRRQCPSPYPCSRMGKRDAIRLRSPSVTLGGRRGASDGLRAGRREASKTGVACSCSRAAGPGVSGFRQPRATRAARCTRARVSSSTTGRSRRTSSGRPRTWLPRCHEKLPHLRRKRVNDAIPPRLQRVELEQLAEEHAKEGHQQGGQDNPHGAKKGCPDPDFGGVHRHIPRHRHGRNDGRRNREGQARNGKSLEHELVPRARREHRRSGLGELVVEGRPPNDARHRS